MLEYIYTNTFLSFISNYQPYLFIHLSVYLFTPPLLPHPLLPLPIPAHRLEDLDDPKIPHKPYSPSHD